MFGQLSFRARNVFILALVTLASTAVLAVTRAVAASTLSGAVSTLAAPLVAEWSQAFQAFYGVGVTFSDVVPQNSVGQVSSGAVDFAASEVPLTAVQAACPGCAQIPWSLTAIGIGYHVPGIGTRLRLTGRVLAEIYLGQITTWNDPQIRALNPLLHLPALKITPIHTTNSGSTYVFTDYLSRVNSAFRTRLGTGVSVPFSTGVTAPNTQTATTVLESTNGALAYLGAPYLIAHKLPAAAIQNAAGNYEYPNLGNVGASASRIRTVPANGTLDIVNPPRSIRFGYPISTFIYVIVGAHGATPALKQWITFGLGLGQTFGHGLDYDGLPPAVIRAAQAQAARL
jgi:phosphate transport system substrate-binding protein